MQGELNIKRFKKHKRISKGGFGVVYKVEEKKTGEFFAAKIIDCNDDEEKCNEMINREISILMYTKHPTIVKFIGYSKTDFQEENNVTIIMELAKNGSLRDVLKMIQQSDGPKNYTNTSRQIILAGVARGMKYLHDRNIIHRDIKPENILLDEDFHPYITDFGLSKIYEEGHSRSQTKYGGTLAYEAPEILKKIKYGPKVDVYSFSILMYEVLTDSVPFPELESGEMADYDFMNKIIKKNYRPKFEVPIKRSHQKLIEQCWSENPDDRPTFDEIFNKLANKKEENDVYLLDDVDLEEFNLYIEDVTEITDSTEKLLNKISVLEEENIQLKKEITKLKSANKKQSDEIETLQNDKVKLRKEIKKLKTEKQEQFDELERIKEELDHIKERIKIRKVHKQSKNKHAQSETNESKQYERSIIVCGYDNYNHLGIEANNVNYENHKIITPPMKSLIDPSTILSFSVYSGHTVIVTNDGSLFGIGNNRYPCICFNLINEYIHKLSGFSIMDENNNKLKAVSAVCRNNGVTYMLSKSNGNGMQIVVCNDVNRGKPYFLDIGDEQPVAIYGGHSHSAVINAKGQVIFINGHLYTYKPKLDPISLPNGEKASFVACMESKVAVLSSNGRVFWSEFKEKSNDLNFSLVSELAKEEIVCLSGTYSSCLAVTKDGRVFGRGYNTNGDLGLGKGITSLTSFTEITSLRNYKIRAAYSGMYHSLFESQDGKVLSCGTNQHGELLLNSEINDNPELEYVYLPVETTIKDGATFCIAGSRLSVVFIGDPPENMTNRRVFIH